MNKVVKWVGIILVVAFVVAIASGYRGGAKSAAGNYHKVMSGH